jgi:hypothetical protein
MSYPKIEELKLNVDCKEDHDKKKSTTTQTQINAFQF